MGHTLMTEILPGTLIVLMLLWKIEMNWRYRTVLTRYFDKDRSADNAARRAIELKEAGHPDLNDAIRQWLTLRAEADALKPWS